MIYAIMAVANNIALILSQGDNMRNLLIFLFSVSAVIGLNNTVMAQQKNPYFLDKLKTQQQTGAQGTKPFTELRKETPQPNQPSPVKPGNWPQASDISKTTPQSPTKQPVPVKAQPPAQPNNPIKIKPYRTDTGDMKGPKPVKIATPQAPQSKDLNPHVEDAKKFMQSVPKSGQK